MNIDLDKKRLYKKTLDTINEHKMLSDNSNLSHILVALSGGADSVALLDFLLWAAENVPKFGRVSISAFHLNHMLRDNADADEAFVKLICKTRGVPLYSEKADVAEFSSKNGLSVEEGGRELRYRLLFVQANRLIRSSFEGEPKGACVVATGHNLNDNTETLLLNITRGSGLAGLSGISPTRILPVTSEDEHPIKIIRPLINCSREEIEHHCEANNLSYVTDESNDDVCYSRNRIRHNVIPELLKINAGLNRNIANLTQLVSADEAFLCGEAEKALDNAKAPPLNGSEGYYSAKKLAELKKPIFSRAIRVLIKKACESEKIKYTSPSKKHLDLIFDKLCVEKNELFELDISKDIKFCLSQNLVRVVAVSQNSKEKPKPQGEIAAVLEKLFVFCDRNILLRVASLQQFHKEEKSFQKTLKNSLDYGKIKGNIILRHRESGDRYSPVNRGGTKSLKKLFNEAKIPAENRDEILVLCDEDGIIWVEHFGCDERVKIDSDTVNVLSVSL